MHYKRGRHYLEHACKGRILDLISDVGWTPIQCEMVQKRYIEFKSMPIVCLETSQSETQFTRNLNKICDRLESYMSYRKDEEISQEFYNIAE